MQEARSKLPSHRSRPRMSADQFRNRQDRADCAWLVIQKIRALLGLPKRGRTNVTDCGAWGDGIDSYLLDEGGSDNDTSAKVSSKEVDVERHTQPTSAGCQHREERGARRDDENHKQRRHADAFYMSERCSMAMMPCNFFFFERVFRCYQTHRGLRCTRCCPAGESR